jgi:hypothetical protein
VIGTPKNVGIGTSFSFKETPIEGMVKIKS